MAIPRTMFERQKEEQTFVEKKRQWKAGMDKPMKRSTFFMMLPALIIGVFLLISAPYIRIIMQKVISKKDEIQPHALNIDDAPEKKEKAEEPLPPLSPEAAQARFYQDRYDKEGFDWRSTPEVDAPESEVAVNAVELSEIPVELPFTMSQLKKMSM